jgi:hypothetical protein
MCLGGETTSDWSSNSKGIAVAITGKSSFQGKRLFAPVGVLAVIIA